MARNTWLQVVLTSAALCVSFWLGQKLAIPSRAKPAHPKAFVLSITIEFEKEDERDAWLNLWGEYAQYVADQEPRTLGFEAMIADNNPNKIMIFERFVSKEDFVEVHQASQPFKDYKLVRNKLPYKTTVSGQSYIETNLGFMS